MVKITKTHIEALGETGAGITSADQIDHTQNNAFVTKWGMGCSRLQILSNAESISQILLSGAGHGSLKCESSLPSAQTSSQLGLAITCQRWACWNISLVVWRVISTSLVLISMLLRKSE
jgi:hypothetical protein